MSPFRAVADAQRRRILDLLTERESTVSDLLTHFDISQPALSQHLRILRGAGLVRHRRKGRHRIYTLDASPLRQVYDWVEHYERFWDDKLDALGQFLELDS